MEVIGRKGIKRAVFSDGVFTWERCEVAVGRSHQLAALFSHNSRRPRVREKLSVDEMVIHILALCGTRIFIGGQEKPPFSRN